jgi:hypothetical protein
MPSLSTTFALWTLAWSTNPCVSTSRWRFRPLTFKGPVVAPFSSSDAGRLHRLAVNYPHARLGIPLEANPHPFAQRGVHPLPDPVQTPRAEVVVDGLPRREVVGQKPPGAAALQEVEDGVEDLAQAVQARSPFVFWDRQERFDALPLGIGKVGWVCTSHSC